MRTVLPSIYENMYLPKMLIGLTMSVTNKSDTAKFPTKINSRDFLLIVWQTDTRIRRFPKVPISAAIARIRTLVKAIPGASQTNWKRPNVFSSASNGDPLLLFILKILKFCWSIFFSPSTLHSRWAMFEIDEFNLPFIKKAATFFFCNLKYPMGFSSLWSLF